MHKALAGLYVDPPMSSKSPSNPPPVIGFGAVENVRADLLVLSEKIILHSSARRLEHLKFSLIAAAAAWEWLEFYLDVMKPKNVQDQLFNLCDALRARTSALGINIVRLSSREQHAPHLYIRDLHDPRWVELLKKRTASSSHRIAWAFALPLDSATIWRM